MAPMGLSNESLLSTPSSSKGSLKCGSLTPTMGYLVQAPGLVRLVDPGLDSEVRPPRERSTSTTCLVDPIVTVSATRLSRFWLHPPHRRALHVPLVLPEEPRVYT